MSDPDTGLQGALEEFFANNPESTYNATAGGCRIGRPWADETFMLQVGGTDKALIDCLNDLHLPPRFTAIYHRKSKDIEFIWAAVPRDTVHRGRTFVFRFHERDYNCEFADASAGLKQLAKAVHPIAPATSSNYRNLLYLTPIVIGGGPKRSDPDPLVASSFWVRDVTWDEGAVVEIAQHLNFYMTLYDSSSPYILIHEPSLQTGPTAPSLPLPGAFPDTITGRTLDSYLLLLWEAGKTRDPFLRFLYHYQILEYAGFYHLEEATAAKLKRLLVTPDALWRLDKTVHEVIDAVAEIRVQDEQKIAAVLKLVVAPDALWPEFERALPYFTEGVSFEGGFCLEPLIRGDWNVDDFTRGGFPKVADYYRKIRNALVHSRERRMTDVIHPTNRNAQLLQPWLPPLRAIAAHAMLYQSV